MDNGFTYEFGDFEFTPSENLLRKRGENLPLTPKAIRLLDILITNRGHLVDKDELLREAWDGAFVEEATVARNVWVLRQALGDDKKNNTMIQTVPKRGYRFVAPVKVVSAPTVEAPILHTPSAEPRRSMPVFLAAGVLALVITAASFAYLNSGEASPSLTLSEHGTTNYDAYQTYLQGMYLYDRRNVQSAQKALELFDKAIELDPKFALAWTGKGRTHRYLAYVRPDSDVHHEYRLSKSAIEQALALDPNLSEAYSATCENKLFYEYEFAGAEANCKRAIELKPGSSVAHEMHARFLTSRGRFDEAISESKTALELDPKSLFVIRNFGATLYFARRYDDAMVQFNRILEMDSSFEATRRWIFVTLQAQGKHSEAFNSFASSLGGPSNEKVLDDARLTFDSSRWSAFLREQANRVDRGNFYRACQYVQVGEFEVAFEFLERALERREWGMAFLQVEPLLDPIRSDFRFKTLLTRVEK